MKRVNYVAYAASTMGECGFQTLFQDSPIIPGQQAQKFNRLLQQGLNQNGMRVTAICAPPVTQRNTDRKIIKVKNATEKGVFYRYIPVLNIPCVKNIFTVISSFFEGVHICLKKDSAVVCDVLNISVSFGAVMAARLCHRPVVGIVTDVPELMVTGHLDKQVQLCYKVINKCSGYVFLTDAMNERLNPNNKPYAIIEGISDSVATKLDHTIKKDERMCLYAGLLDAEYGVKDMVDGFIEANIPHAVLHLCGSGPYEKELTEVAALHSNVVYHGSVMNKRVVEMEQEAVLLVNPRPSCGEFTKFSFPSKIIEYMSSGTSTMATKLPGVPNEYYDYLIPIEDETKYGIAKAFQIALSKTDDELKFMGERARDWVVTHKSFEIQGEHLAQLLQAVSKS